jgi:uncharacterized protein (DUF433 family)
MHWAFKPGKGTADKSARNSGGVKRPDGKRYDTMSSVRQLTFSQTVPLQQDETGTVRIEGSRVTLDTVIAAFERGATAEQIQDSFPSLSLRQIYAAIAYCLDRQDEVEAYLKERKVEAEAIRREVESQPHYKEFRERIRRRTELADA